MTIEQAIEHAEDIATSAIGCECREEHRQLATWLRELQERRKAPEIIYCHERKHRDPEDKKCDCGHDIIWQLPRGDDWYCADAERKTE